MFTRRSKFEYIIYVRNILKGYFAMLENEYQPNIEETEVCPKRSKTIKIYAVAAVAAAIVAVLLRTVCLFYFYDMEIGYHSEGFVTSLYKVFCLLSALFFASAVVFVKRNTATPDGKTSGFSVKLGSAAAMLAFAAYFSILVFSADMVSTSGALDLLSKITALMGIVYFAIAVFAPDTNKNIRALLGFGVIIWCIYVLGVTYFDIFVQLNSPDKVTLHLALISMMVFIVCELRCFVLEIKKGFSLFSACCATFFCSLSSVPSFLFGASIGEMNKYYTYDIVIFAVGFYALGRLISFAFFNPIRVEETAIAEPCAEIENAEAPDASSETEKESDV